MNIPTQHQVILEGVSKSHQVGGKVAIMKIYNICASILEGGEAPVRDIAVWKHDDDKLRIVIVTDLTTGVYIQLSQDKTIVKAPALMTVGKKFSMEIHDAVTSSRMSRMFF